MVSYLSQPEFSKTKESLVGDGLDFYPVMWLAICLFEIAVFEDCLGSPQKLKPLRCNKNQPSGAYTTVPTKVN